MDVAELLNGCGWAELCFAKICLTVLLVLWFFQGAWCMKRYASSFCVYCTEQILDGGTSSCCHVCASAQHVLADSASFPAVLPRNMAIQVWCSEWHKVRLLQGSAYVPKIWLPKDWWRWLRILTPKWVHFYTWSVSTFLYSAGTRVCIAAISTFLYLVSNCFSVFEL